MSRDFALLFPSVPTLPKILISNVLPLLKPIGARYGGVATRMKYGMSGPYWSLTTDTRNAPDLSAIDGLLQSWDGLALELESKFAPMKLMVWKEKGVMAGFGLFETSSMFTAQAEDPDVCDIFDSIALDIAEVTKSDDPGVASLTREQIVGFLSKSPGPTLDPLVYAAGLKIASDYSAAGNTASREWVQHQKDGFLVFRYPDFGKVLDE
jgi:hypothetical protein